MFISLHQTSYLVPRIIGHARRLDIINDPLLPPRVLHEKRIVPTSGAHPGLRHEISPREPDVFVGVVRALPHRLRPIVGIAKHGHDHVRVLFHFGRIVLEPVLVARVRHVDFEVVAEAAAMREVK